MTTSLPASTRYIATTIPDSDACAVQTTTPAPAEPATDHRDPALPTHILDMLTTARDTARTLGDRYFADHANRMIAEHSDPGDDECNTACFGIRRVAAYLIARGHTPPGWKLTTTELPAPTGTRTVFDDDPEWHSVSAQNPGDACNLYVSTITGIFDGQPACFLRHETDNAIVLDPAGLDTLIGHLQAAHADLTRRANEEQD